MVKENSGNNCIYAFYSGKISELAGKVTSFCQEKFPESCEFESVKIDRVHPDDHSWTVHEFPNLDERAVRAIENHLNARRDLVKITFGAGDDVMEIFFCKGRNSSRIARYVKNEDREELAEDDLVVVAIDGDSDFEKAEEFLRSLE